MAYGDICLHYFATDLVGRLKCHEVSNGIMKKGLATSVVTLLDNCNTVLTLFYQSQRSNADIKYTVNSAMIRNLIEIKDYTVNAMDFLTNLFKDSFINYITNVLEIEKIKFSIFIIAIFIVYLIFWRPFLENLNGKIWRTKGMLNMIPMDIIGKNENLKVAFISGEIIQAVK